MVLSGLSDSALALSTEFPAARPRLRSLFESIVRLSGQHVLWNYFQQRRDYLEEGIAARSSVEPHSPQFHPLVAATLRVDPSDVATPSSVCRCQSPRLAWG